MFSRQVTYIKILEIWNSILRGATILKWSQIILRALKRIGFLMNDEFVQTKTLEIEFEQPNMLNLPNSVKVRDIKILFNTIEFE